MTGGWRAVSFIQGRAPAGAVTVEFEGQAHSPGIMLAAPTPHARVFYHKDLPGRVYETGDLPARQGLGRDGEPLFMHEDETLIEVLLREGAPGDVAWHRLYTSPADEPDALGEIAYDLHAVTSDLRRLLTLAGNAVASRLACRIVPGHTSPKVSS